MSFSRIDGNQNGNGKQKCTNTDDVTQEHVDAPIATCRESPASSSGKGTGLVDDNHVYAEDNTQLTCERNSSVGVNFGELPPALPVIEEAVAHAVQSVATGRATSLEVATEIAVQQHYACPQRVAMFAEAEMELQRVQPRLAHAEKYQQELAKLHETTTRYRESTVGAEHTVANWANIALLFTMSLGSLGIIWAITAVLAHDLMNFDLWAAVVAGGAPTITVFCGTKVFVAKSQWKLSAWLRATLYVLGIGAVAANMVILGCQKVDPTSRAEHTRVPAEYAFLAVLAMDAIAVASQALLWYDHRVRTHRVIRDENPSWTEINNKLVEEEVLLGELRSKQRLAQVTLHWLETDLSALATRYVHAIDFAVPQVQQRNVAATRSVMKRLVPVLLLMAVLGCAREVPRSVEPREIFIVVDGNALEAEREKIDSWIRASVTTMPPKSIVTLCSQNEIIAKIRVPEAWNAIHVDSAGTMDALEKASAFLLSHSASAKTSRDNASTMGLDLPAFFKFLESHRSMNGTRVDAVIVADPTYRTRPAWAFENGRYPSDATLKDQNTPFGMLREPQPGLQIQVVSPPRTDWGKSDTHRERVERFWRLYCQKLDATLHAFDSNLDGALDRVASGNYRGVPIETADGDPESCMREVQAEESIASTTPEPVTVPVRPGNRDPQAIERTYPVPAGLQHFIVDNKQGETTILVNWWSQRNDNVATDVDIWVNPAGAPQDVLNFGNKNKAFGTLERDIRHPGSRTDAVDGDVWEVVTLKTTDLSKFEIYLDSYFATGPLTVRVVVKVGNSPAVDLELPFPCPSGDSSSDVVNRATSRHWLRIDPLLAERIKQK